MCIQSHELTLQIAISLHGRFVLGSLNNTTWKYNGSLFYKTFHEFTIVVSNGLLNPRLILMIYVKRLSS